MPTIQGVQDEATFVQEVARGTGLDPRVILEWIRVEGAYAPGGTGGFNFLNLRPYSSDVGVAGQSPGGFDRFTNVDAAAVSTIRRIRQPFLWDALGPVVAKKGSPAEEIAAIGRSGWDAGHYQEGGGAPGSSIANRFIGDYGQAAYGSAPAGPGAVAAHGTGPGSTGATSVAGDVAGAAGGAASAVGGAIAGPFAWVEKLVKVIFGPRGLQMGAGFLLVILGVLWLSRGRLPASVQPGGEGVGGGTPPRTASPAGDQVNIFEHEPGMVAHAETRPTSRARDLSRPTRSVKPITDVSRPLRRRAA